MSAPAYKRDGSVVTGPGLEYHAKDGKLVFGTVPEADRWQRLLQCAYNMGVDSVRQPILVALFGEDRRRHDDCVIVDSTQPDTSPTDP
jgi:hypothetical protein